jgi:hypothetical protein
MKFLIISFSVMSAFSFAETDPCKLNYKNSDCQFRMRYSLSGQFDKDGKSNRPDYGTYVNNYYKKYGLEGFLYHDQLHSTLFEDAFSSCENDAFKLKLLKDFPKGRVVEGKNIYQLMLPKFVLGSKNSLGNFLFSLNVLFPEKDNENLRKTNELFGLPWDDPSFLDGYLDIISKAIIEIDRKNALFKSSEYIDEKEKLQKILDRLTPFAKVSKEVCTYTKMEEIESVQIKYRELFQSSQKNVIGCLLKNQQCELAGSLINSGDYPPDRLSEYFDSIIKLKNSKACLESMKSIYMTMLRNGNPITSDPKYESVATLKEVSTFYQKYPFDDQPLCETEFMVHRNNLDDFTENLQRVMEKQGHDLMTSILNETDAAKKEALINQFVDMTRLNVDLSKTDPATGKSILQQIADFGDYKLWESLNAKGVGPYSLGFAETNKEGLNPLYDAIYSGELNKLKFASGLYSSLHNNAGDMLTAKKFLKKIKTKDPEIKQFIEDFKTKIEVDISHEY